MKLSFLLVCLSLLVSTQTYAEDDLVPATSEDIEKFDDSVAEKAEKAEKVKDPKKDRKENFGSKVSEEAHRMKELPKEERTGMGKWVSGQRRQNGDKKDSTMGAAGDARVSAPKKGNDSKSNRGR